MNELKKNEIYTVRSEGYTSDAMGVCHVNGRTVFVPYVLSGETCDIKLLKVTASECYAKMTGLASPSSERREPQCPYFGKCGGCDAMHMSYEEELRFKLAKVNDALTRIGRQSVCSEQILGSDVISNYRNKAIYTVSNTEAGPAFGFYRERSHQLVAIEQCAIQNQLSNQAAAAVVSFMREYDIPAYDELSGKGCVRHIFCREAVNTDDAVLCIVANKGFGGLTDTLVNYLRSKCPRLTGIVLNINKASGNRILGDSFFTLWGKAEITDILRGFRFSIAPQAFFQINPPQAEKLYRKAVEYAAVGDTSLAFDLYCGAGTISLCLAKNFERVIGAEIVPEAVENASHNAFVNGVDNTEFVCADAGQAAQMLSQRALKPDVILVDPPRKGMDQAAVEAVASIAPARVVYVSCDPATLARDVLRFSRLGYELVEATAVDMFPRTSHVETCVLLSHKNS